MEWPNEIMRNVPANRYHAMPGISPSRAKYAIESPRAYKAALDEPFEATDEMDLGTACHFAVWQPDLLPLHCVVWDQGPRRGKAWEQFADANASKIILTENNYAKLLKVRDRCQEHPAIRSILARRGESEISMRWTTDTDAGDVRCRGRVDYLSDRIYDLKTTREVTDRAIASTVVRLSYHLQMAAYQDGHSIITGEAKDCVLIFAQTASPFDARVVVLGADALEHGHRLWMQAIETIAAAERTGIYLGINEDESPLILPAWALDSGEIPVLTLDGMAVGL